MAALLVTNAALLAAFLNLHADYARLQSEHEKLMLECSSLYQRYASLEASHRHLQSAYSELQASCEELQREYSDLRAIYSDLNKSCAELLRINQRLEEKVSKYAREVAARLGLDSGATKLVQPNDPQVVHLVGQIIGGEGDLHQSLFELYAWTASNVRYETDPHTTLIYPRAYAVLLGHRVLVDVGLVPGGGYWRSASEVLQRGAGDCEDQAILLASMVKAYFLHYLKQNLTAYVLTVVLPHVVHALVIVPLAGGDIIILDPTGRYYTGWPGPLTSAPIEVEFSNYERWWRAKIVNFRVVMNEERYVVVNGNLSALREAISG